MEVDPLLTNEQLADEYGIKHSRSTRWRLERDGLFPRRVRTSPKTHAWRRSEVLAWIEAQSSGRKLNPPNPLLDDETSQALALARAKQLGACA